MTSFPFSVKSDFAGILETIHRLEYELAYNR